MTYLQDACGHIIGADVDVALQLEDSFCSSGAWLIRSLRTLQTDCKRTQLMYDNATYVLVSSADI